MEALLKVLKQVQGVARSSDSGEVLAAAGNFDSDTLSAVAAVGSGPLRELGDLLSAGRLERWYVTTETHTYYVSERPSERLVAAGDAVKNPEATSKTLHAAK